MSIPIEQLRKEIHDKIKAIGEYYKKKGHELDISVVIKGPERPGIHWPP